MIWKTNWIIKPVQVFSMFIRSVDNGEADESARLVKSTHAIPPSCIEYEANSHKR